MLDFGQLLARLFQLNRDFAALSLKLAAIVHGQLRNPPFRLLDECGIRLHDELLRLEVLLLFNPLPCLVCGQELARVPIASKLVKGGLLLPVVWQHAQQLVVHLPGAGKVMARLHQKRLLLGDGILPGRDIGVVLR